MTGIVPCGSCPWRVGSHPDRIPGFGLDQAEALACTVGDDDAFRKVMACHASPEGGEEPCVGYVAVEGVSNLAVRLMAATGVLPLGAIQDACADLDLYGSFGDMLDNLRANTTGRPGWVRDRAGDVVERDRVEFDDGTSMFVVRATRPQAGRVVLTGMDGKPRPMLADDELWRAET